MEEEVNRQYRGYILGFIGEHPGEFGTQDLIDRVKQFGMRNVIIIRNNLDYPKEVVDEMIKERRIELRNSGNKRYPNLKLYPID